MPQFTRLESACIPFNRNNVDTDQIIPARFLKGTSKEGLGEKLFYDWRYNEDGSAKPDFILNLPGSRQSAVLVAPHNFGCGSSREHAPWALKDYGFQAILAVSFADIFRNNSLKNGLLTIQLPEPVILNLLQRLESGEGIGISIDLPAQTVTLPGEPVQHFDIDPYRKKCLVDGLDDIGYTLSQLERIQAYEAAR